MYIQKLADALPFPETKANKSLFSMSYEFLLKKSGNVHAQL